MEYARTVKPTTSQPGSLPDAGVLFDTLMAREKPELHPTRISSMLFYLASIIIHDLFRTSHKDFNVSETSSYLDLSPLYGSDWDEQKRMRTFKDGKIKRDCFSETRLLSFPPGVGAILIMFNRFHNSVVEQLALVNEDGRFTKPAKDASEEKWTKYDNDLFQTGRLVTCGLYINIILIDYVRTILNLNRSNSNWQLNPRADIPGGPEIGVGNQVSAEFNLVYRWHSAVSDKDDKWTQELFKEIFDGRLPSEVSQKELIITLSKLEATLGKQEPDERPFAQLERVDGKFKDNDLTKILVEGIEDCANAFGPRQVPTVMKAIEVLGIQQARSWNLATLNEFRKHFALTPHRTFDDITKNKEVADKLKHLYDHPDNVELYPGLVVEDGKDPMVPGSGLCPSYTVSRAVLSDAVALVRGDRFYTTGYTPQSLTNWGFSEANYNLDIDNGCVFYKLFLRALPNSFEANSVYVHYPLTIPSEMETVLHDLRKAEKYSFKKPEPITQPQMVFSYDAAEKILFDQDAFKVTWGDAMERFMGSDAREFCLAGDGPPNAKSRSILEKDLYLGGSSRAIPKGDEAWLLKVRKATEQIVTSLLKDKSYGVGGKTHQVDIIRDVGNYTQVHLAAQLFGLPLKTADFVHGIYTEQQLYLIMAGIFIGIFYDVDPESSFNLRQQAQAASTVLRTSLTAELEAINTAEALANYVQKHFESGNALLKDYGVHMLEKLLSSDLKVAEVVANIMGTCGGMVGAQSQLFGQIMDYFFTEGNQYWPKVVDLAKQNTPEADDTLEHYVLEACRLYGGAGVSRVATQERTIKDYDRTLTFKPGDAVVVNFKSAGRDESAFPEPDTLRLDRPVEKYIHQGHGPHQCLGLPMSRVVLTTMVKTIARLEKLQAAPAWPGPKSTVKKVVKPFYDGDTLPESWHFAVYLTENWDQYFPFPTCKWS